MAETFLDSIAKAYVENFDDISEFCFVFPNKRSGTFFRRALTRQLGSRVRLAPEIMSISDLVEKLSGLETATRIELLFRLFNIYRNNKELIPSKAKDNDLLEFDAFRSWGEILLSDFSEVDQYGVDADALFTNVSDYREISSNFLTDEQIEVLERYFGYSPSTADVSRFWKSFSQGSGKSDIKQRFMYLWQAMAPLYHSLNDSLESEGLATQGLVYRRALENVIEQGRDLLPYKKIIFVGFNALSTTEALLFEALAKAGGYYADEKEAYVDYYWDATGPILESEESDASMFLRLNKRNFPSPDWARDWIERNRVSKMPADMKVIASPSNSAQTKIAARSLSEIIERVGGEEVQDAKVAVVLPDENLLLPLLYALPESLDKVNLTMGYSLRLTSVASFLHHLRGLHARSRMTGGELTFFHEDVKLLLSHPFTHALLGSRNVAVMNTYMAKHHKFRVSIEEFRRETGGDDRLPLDVAAYGVGTKAGVSYIDDVLMRIDASLADNEGGVVKSRIDRSHIALYRDALRRLESNAFEHGVEMGLSGVFYMVDKLLAGEHVSFEGEPLEGLQVMGLLETRALDFDHLVILSMNDKVMPRKARRATFIPDSLRRGYGLPYSNYQERLFSYYFYRMISRVKSVTLIYDARSGEGMRSGGESRYLTQLRYLYAPGKIKYENYQFLISEPGHDPEPLEKTPEIMEKVQEYARKGSDKNLSASALRKYGECQIRFYYEEVEGLRTDTAETEFINPITQGNIVHDTMLMLYFPEPLRKKYLKERIRISPEALDAMIKDRERIRILIRKNINKHHYNLPEAEQDTPLEGAASMVAGHLEQVVTDILRYDRKLAPFDLAGGEMSASWRWEYDTDKFVNMKFAIDRLDILNPGRENEQWRIVDYKTGQAHVEASEFEDIFNGAYSAKNFFQLMLYANLMNLYTGQDKDVKVAIYSTGKLLKKGETLPKIGSEVIKGHKQINEAFVETLNARIDELFDPARPFLPAGDPDNCTYCLLHDLCRRTR